MSQSTPRIKYGFKVLSVQAAELQEIVSDAVHNLPQGGEGLEVRIKDTPAAGAETSWIGESK